MWQEPPRPKFGSLSQAHTYGQRCNHFVLKSIHTPIAHAYDNCICRFLQSYFSKNLWWCDKFPPIPQTYLSLWTFRLSHHSRLLWPNREIRGLWPASPCLPGHLQWVWTHPCLTAFIHRSVFTGIPFGPGGYLWTRTDKRWFLCCHGCHSFHWWELRTLCHPTFQAALGTAAFIGRHPAFTQHGLYQMLFFCLPQAVHAD